MSQVKIGRPAVIPVSKIRENSEALRTEVEKEGLQYLELVNAIRTHGFTSAIEVIERKDSETGEEYFQLVDGLQRFTAACEVGMDQIPAVVLDLEQSDVLAAQVMANATRVDTKPAQYAAALKKVLQLKPNLTSEELGASVGKSKAWVESQLKLTKLTPGIQKLVDDGKMAVTNAVSLASLPAEKQEEYMTEAMSQSPAVFGPKVVELVKELRKAAREGRPAVIEFKPLPIFRKTAAVKAVIDEIGTGVSNTIKGLLDSNGITDPYEAAALMAKWFMSLDPISVNAQRAKWDTEQAEKKAAKEAREAERAKKKEEAAKAAAATVTA